MIAVGYMLEVLLLFAVCASFGQMLLVSACGATKAEELVYFSPAVGLAFWVVISSFLVKYTGILFPGFLLSFYVVFIAALIFNYKYSHLKKSHWMILGVFCILAAIPALMGLFRYGIFCPYGGDPIYYINVAQRATVTYFYNTISFPNNTSSFFPSLSLVAAWEEQDSRLGTLFLLSVFQKVLSIKWSFQAFPVLVALGVATGGATVMGAIRLAAGKPLLCIPFLMGLALAVTPNGFNWASLVGFYPQTIAIPILLALFSLLSAFCVSWEQGVIVASPKLKEIAILSLLFASLIDCYPDVVMAFLATASIFSIYHLFRSSNNAMAEMKKIIKIFVFIMLGAALLSIHELFTFAAKTNFVFGLFSHGMLNKPGQVGSPNLWSAWEYISLAFGFRPWDEQFLLRTFGMHFGAMVMARKVALMLTIIAVAWTAGFLMLNKSYRRYSLAMPLIFTLLILGLALLWFRYFVSSPWGIGVGHSFLQLRTATWSSIFCFVLFGTALALLMDQRYWLRLIFCLAVSIWILAGYLHSYGLAETATSMMKEQTAGQGFDGLLQIRQAAMTIPSSEPIFIDIPFNSVLEVWLRYVLWDHMLVGYWVGEDINQNKAYFCHAHWRLHFSDKTFSVDAIHPLGNMTLEHQIPTHQCQAH